MNEPFDMLTFANRLLAGMAARHDPQREIEALNAAFDAAYGPGENIPLDDGERWNAETREEYENWLAEHDQPRE